MIFSTKYCPTILLLGLLLMFTLTSCEKYPDPSIQNLINYSYSTGGSNQRAFSGNFLKDSITLFISGDAANSSGFEIHYDVLKGGGSVDQNIVLTELFQSARVKWKLGDLPGEQILKTSIYLKTGRFLGSLNSFSYGFKHHVWQPVTTNPELKISDMVNDTLNHLTIISSDNQLYKQGANYFDWTPLESFQSQWISSVEIDKNGIIYVAKWNGELLKSIDHGDNWIKCNKPIPSYSSYYYLKVTPDGTIWVSSWDYPLRFSKDGGVTWTITNLPINQPSSTIFRLSDGSILLLSNSTQLFRSDDDGMSWTNLNVAGYPMNLYVTEKDEVIIITQEEGFSIRRSVDRGDHFARVYNILHYGAGVMGHGIYKKRDVYYILIEGKGIITTFDFQNFMSLWNSNEIFDMFIDHQGTIITTEFHSAKAYYYSNDNF
jgi:hypothetical protein